MGGPSVISNDLLVADERPVLEAFSFLVPRRSMLTSSNVASPAAFVSLVVVPLSVPLPEVMLKDTETPAWATSRSQKSLSWTVTGGLMVEPAAVLVGCWTNATLVAAFGLARPSGELSASGVVGACPPALAAVCADTAEAQRSAAAMISSSSRMEIFNRVSLCCGDVTVLRRG